MRRILALAIALLATLPAHAHAQPQDRDTKVRKDRDSFKDSQEWIYNNLDEGIKVAKAANKPLLVVFRCIPCEACQEFDDDVARRDPVIRDLMDEFVCVRIVQANQIDLTRFQYDFDQSFAVVLMNPDGTIYGRFGTRSGRDEEEDISLGLRRAMEAALKLHADDATIRPSLAGKQVEQGRYKTPRDYPSLAGKYGKALDYEGQVAKSCIHCHQIREAERIVYRSAGKPLPDDVLYPYPDPSVLGLKFDPDSTAKVETVEPGSSAAKDGLKVGDRIARLDGQPILSVADIQWILHKAPATAEIPAVVERGVERLETTIHLRDGWRRGDISWRATTWDLRRMAFGGMKLDELTPDERAKLKLSDDALGLKVRHVGQYSDHAVAKKAGVRAGDLVVGFDGITADRTESDLLAHALQGRKPGDEIPVTILRDGVRKVVTIRLQ